MSATIAGLIGSYGMKPQLFNLNLATNIVNSYNTTLVDYNSGITFSNDGQYMYLGVSAPINYGRIRQYTLSTPWDITTATFTRSKDLSIPGYMCPQYTWNPTGTRLIVCENNQHGYGAGGGKQGDVWQYNLSTPWDISTATPWGYGAFIALANFDSTVYDWRCDNFVFSPDGTYCFWLYSSVSAGGSWMQSVQLSTPFDITTRTGASKLLDLHTIYPYAYGGDIRFSSDGNYFYWSSGTYLIEAVMSTPWDITTATNYKGNNSRYSLANRQHPALTTPAGADNIPPYGYFSRNDNYPYFYIRYNDQYVYQIQVS